MGDKAPLKWMEDCSVTLIQSISQLKEWLEQGSVRSKIALDFETDSVDAWSCNVVGVCLAWDSFTACYIPVGHQTESDKNVDHDEAWNVLIPVLNSKEILVFNWGFEGLILPRFGVTNKKFQDMMPAVYLADMDSKQYNLKYGANRYLGLEVMAIESVPGVQIKEGRKLVVHFEMCSPQDALWYGAQDALLTYRLYEHLRPKVRAVQGTAQWPGFILDVENQMMEVVNRMVTTGVMIDRAFLDSSLDDAERWKDLAEARLRETLGADINLDSSAKVAEAMVAIGVPLPKTKPSTRYPDGQYSTNGKLMAMLKKEHPEWAELLEDLELFRSLCKDAGTYIERLKEATADDPVIRIKINSCGAPTGRMSSGGSSGSDGYAQVNGQSIPATSDMSTFEVMEVENPESLSGPMRGVPNE